MPAFLFSATDNTGKNIIDRVEAENLSQAKYKLEIKGYTEISFYHSELNQDVLETFDESAKKYQGELLKNQVAIQYDTRLWRHFTMLLKISGIFWIALIVWVIYSGSTLSFLTIGLFAGLFVYFFLPTALYHKLVLAVFMARKREARIWIMAARSFNLISIVKIPGSDLDYRAACVDAQQGNLNSALQRIANYRNHPKVTSRMYYTYLYTIHGYAKRYDEVLRYQAASIKEGNEYPEELLDHALTLAWRGSDTEKAREFVQRALEKEMSVMASLFVPLAQGVIEVMEGNLERAEFYLTDAKRRYEPFRKNDYLNPSRSALNAFLSIALRARGEFDEANRLLDEARPYLIAHQETELLARCGVMGN